MLGRKVADAVWGGVLESATFTLREGPQLNVVGVPFRSPLLLKWSPDGMTEGRAEAALQVRVPLPLAAVNCAE